MIRLAERQGLLRGLNINFLQQWALAWLIIEEKNEKARLRDSDQEYMLWLKNPLLWKEIYGNDAMPDDEKNVATIYSDELGALDKFLHGLDKKKTVKNKDLESWSDWI